MAGRTVSVAVQQFLIAMGLQVAVVSYGRVLGISPNILLAWVLCLIWLGLETIALPAAVLCGIFFDLLVKGPPGWSSLLLTVIAYAAGKAGRPGLRGRIALAMAAGAVYGLFLAFSPGEGFAWNGTTVARWATLSAVYNTCAALCLDALSLRAPWKKRGFSHA